MEQYQTKKEKFKIVKWIMLSLAVLSNAFIVFYSCLDSDTTAKWNSSFTNFFVNLVNGFTNKEVENIPLEKCNASLSSQESYQYNYLPGYKAEEIPLGSAKQIECSFYPDNATDKSVIYSANPSDAVILNQSGSKVSVVGMKTGECVITAKSHDGGFESTVMVRVVETVAPVSYEISLENTNIAIGTTQTINFDIDGGVLSHNELINFRYYDTRKLSYSSLDESVATVDNYGVVYPQNVGTTTITVSNGDYSKSLNVSVTNGSTPTPYSNLSISGSNVCYANDMILDQNSKKNHYQLTPKDGETELNPEDFIWSSSNDLLVKVDKHGVMRGFRKNSLEDETAVITAKSKLTGQKVTYNVTIKNQLPSIMYYVIRVGEKETWAATQYTLSVGDVAQITISYDVRVQNNVVNVACSDESIVSFSNEGSAIILRVLKDGNCTLTLTPTINPSLKAEIAISAVKAGAISTDDISNIGTYIRKSLGHAAVFMVAQIFTFLTLFMFFYERKWWFYSSISLGEGLFISGLSEIIQAIVPSRNGRFLDVVINFAGVVVGAALTFLGIFIVKKIIAKKKTSSNEEK